MAKIHTHYDNLKVARQAPQEVIRAAYKALSQKYHPDKNPGDEKAARIMAIVNSAYTTLSDPQRRQEHDEWITAEEWEIAWLESTRHEDNHHDAAPGWTPRSVPPHAGGVKPSRRSGMWMALAACFLAGGVAGGMVAMQPRLVPAALASAMAVLPDAKADAHVPAAKAAPARTESLDNWAVSKAALTDSGAPKAPEVRALGVAQFVVPARAPDCDSVLRSLVAPNGEKWPEQSGYVDGYPVADKGEEMQLQVDNGGNNSAVFVKVFDLDKRSNVRHVFVSAHDKLTVDKLAAGRYELRYQNLDVGADAVACPSRKTDIATADGAAHRDAE